MELSKRCVKLVSFIFIIRCLTKSNLLLLLLLLIIIISSSSSSSSSSSK